MSDNGFPSMTALLGLLAVAGFQNRDKIGEFLGGLGGSKPQPGGLPSGSAAPPTPHGDLLGNLATNLGASNVGGFLGSGLGELMDRFKVSGHGDAAQSWIDSGPNHPVAPHQLEQAIGPDVLTQLQQRTGLTRDELLGRLSKALPDAVDKYTPDGRLPSAA